MVIPLILDVFVAERARRGMPPIYAVVSFADSAYGHHGGVYQAMSWTYTGESARRGYKYTDSDGRLRHSRQRGVNITPDMARARGWAVSPSSSVKYRYLKMIAGSARHRKALRRMCNLPSLPYPKPSRDQIKEAI